MEKKKWRNEYGGIAMRYGGKRDGLRDGKRVVPIVKKGEGERVEDYRGMTISIV